MNIAFFLLPKKDVVYLSPETTMRQAMERMERHRYTAVPLVTEDGRYYGTVTEGDLLWKLKNTPGFCLQDTEKILLKDIPQYVKNQWVKINTEIEDLISLAAKQSFVPVVDDQEIFIGIVRRREIIEYCLQFFKSKDG